MVGGPHQLYTRRATRAKLWIPHDVGGELRALRGAKRMPQSDWRMSSRRQRTCGSEFRPLGPPRDHHDSHLATDDVLRNDRCELRGTRCYMVLSSLGCSGVTLIWSQQGAR